MQEINPISSVLSSLHDTEIDWKLLTEIAIAWLSLLLTAAGVYWAYLKWRASVIVITAQDWIALQERNDGLSRRNEELNEKLDREREQRRKVEDQVELMNDEMHRNSVDCKKSIQALEERIRELEARGNS